jgi:hypothetical protein
VIRVFTYEHVASNNADTAGKTRILGPLSSELDRTLQVEYGDLKKGKRTSQGQSVHSIAPAEIQDMAAPIEPGALGQNRIRDSRPRVHTLVE